MLKSQMTARDWQGWCSNMASQRDQVALSGKHDVLAIIELATPIWLKKKKKKAQQPKTDVGRPEKLIIFFFLALISDDISGHSVLMHRATAAGIHLLMGRIGAIFGTNIFGAFVRVNPSIPILIVAGVLLVGGVAALPLPKTTRKTLLKWYWLLLSGNL